MRTALSDRTLAPRGGQNPFSTRRVRPGAIPYLFPDETGPAELMRQYHRFQGWGQIVGPHGTGKSTLLRWLMRQIAGSAEEVVLVSLRPDPGGGPVVAPDVRRNRPGTLLLIDGYQQLAWWRRWRLQHHCRQRHIGLIVTTHRSLGLATLYRTHVTPAVAQAIVDGLLAEHTPALGRGHRTSETGRRDLNLLRGREEIAQRLTEHRGNMRETLFSLYDTFEQLRRGSECDSTALGSGESGRLDRAGRQSAPV